MKEWMSKIQEYQKELGYDFETMTREEMLEYARACSLALFQEVAELVDSFPWKPWRAIEDQTMDRENLKREIVDCIFFLSNIASCFDISPRELDHKFHMVLMNNLDRIRNGYNKVKED